MSKQRTQYPKEFIEFINSITNKRAKVVIDHIIKYGSITTEDLENKYGYNHPPRAARDVREAGIPLITTRVKSKGGKNIAAYKFGDLSQLKTKRVSGRILFSKKFKELLYKEFDGRCQVCHGKFEQRYLQIDHRVPYEVAGDLKNRKPEDFLLLCSSCNRAKSWSCEHCENWKNMKDSSICMNCYWGNPKQYNHISLEDVRRLDVQWSGSEVKYYDAIKILADKRNIELPEFVKKVISDKAKKIKR